MQFTLLKYDESTLLQSFWGFFNFLNFHLKDFHFHFVVRLSSQNLFIFFIFEIYFAFYIKSGLLQFLLFYVLLSFSWSFFTFFYDFPFFKNLLSYIHTFLAFKLDSLKLQIFCQILKFNLSCCNILKVLPRLFTIYKRFFSKNFFIWHFTTFFFTFSSKLIFFFFLFIASFLSFFKNKPCQS